MAVAQSTPSAARIGDPAGILPNCEARTHFMVQANPVRNEFELYFSAGPTGRHGNVRAQIALTPDQAERIARQIIADLEGWPEQVTKAQAAFGVTA